MVSVSGKTSIINDTLVAVNITDLQPGFTYDISVHAISNTVSGAKTTISQNTSQSALFKPSVPV